MKDKILSEIHAALKEAENLARNLGKDLGAYEVEDLGCPHTPPKLDKDKAAVYIFIDNKTGEFLKIGKANAKSKARFTSQHYGFNAPSTLAKSLCADKSYAKFGLKPENIKAWMLNNLRRINIYIDTDKDPRKTALKTALIEAILHYKFEPRFEGKTE